MSKNSTYSSANAQCPFYKGEETHRVICEGIQGRSSLHVTFAGNCMRFKEQYCYDSWLQCPVANMLWELKDK